MDRYAGNAVWKGHVSFSTVAEKCGVGDFWQPGSKLPALTALLQRTLEHRRGSFERLVLEIVRAGLVYRKKQKRPILPAEIQKLNGHLVDVGFKFPDLWDREFVESPKIPEARTGTRNLTQKRIRIKWLFERNPSHCRTTRWIRTTELDA
jgi:hypothetical protein